MLSTILAISNSGKYHHLFAALTDLGIKTDHVQSCNEALTVLTTNPYAAVLMEEVLLVNPTDTVEKIHRIKPQLPFVVFGNGPTAGDHKQGQSEIPSNYLPLTGVENVDLARLLNRLKELLPELRAEVLPGKDLLWIKSNNQAMIDVISLVDIIKDDSSTVLIQGENGTGKEFIAWLLHYSGRRYTTPYVAINCAAIPETLLESELFGHEKGSFTGATEKRIGKFELADKGTAFLDEIGDMPLSTQAKILRVLEKGMVERVGGHRNIPVDVRIVAATNQNLQEKIEVGLFRRDLYYRINTFTLKLPRLAERPEDILPLAKHFLDMITPRRGQGTEKRLSQAAGQLLMDHDWPGNVRELRNAMERVAILTPGDVIEPESLPEDIRGKRDHTSAISGHPKASAASDGRVPIMPLEELERMTIVEALSKYGADAEEAARQLGISKATLYRKLKKYGIVRRLTVKN
ncbi:MAG: sigma-54 dependent transcriptional regulator [Deltaproteobacteria bacterium]|nr:sigma-54 dependent transcriptional regulator [Deltaproteobacteria bacterium]